MEQARRPAPCVQSPDSLVHQKYCGEAVFGMKFSFFLFFVSPFILLFNNSEFALSPPHLISIANCIG